MPRGAAPGERRGGRAKGTVNKHTADLQAKLDAIGFDAVLAMAHFALGRIPCIACEQTGHAANGEPCPKCDGTGTELVATDTRARMAAEVAQYVLPKRKAVEMSQEGGGPMLITHITIPGAT